MIRPFFKRLIKACALIMVFSVAVLCLSVSARAQTVSKTDVEREANAGNFGKAYEVLVRLAESGNAQAQGFLAYVLYEGEWGVPVDEAKAKAWMQSALDQNDAYAHLFVALTNMPDAAEENANDPSLIQSHDWKTNIRISAENGHPYAQHMVGSWALGNENYKNAEAWFRKAAIPGRDYYAVEMLMAQSWYQNRKNFLIDAIYDKSHAGNTQGFEALATAYAVGINTRISYRKALFFSAQAFFLGGSRSEKLQQLLSRKISGEERTQISLQAFQQLLAWIKTPETYLGKASSVCFLDEEYDLDCIKHAVEDHRFCETGYILWGFDNFVEFPAYISCRKSFYEDLPLN